MSMTKRAPVLLTGHFALAGCHAQSAGPAPVAPYTSGAPAVPAPAVTNARAQSTADSTWCSAPVHSSAEREHGVSGALAALNVEFLKAHAEARAQSCHELE